MVEEDKMIRRQGLASIGSHSWPVPCLDWPPSLPFGFPMIHSTLTENTKITAADIEIKQY